MNKDENYENKFKAAAVNMSLLTLGADVNISHLAN